ncbi:helix-turn-helix domain-containing protein [Klenkia sp. PcliD-1-E]|uniref:helix-turn-helix domain-containing protein n=1 Tax=Klenkia sp. PcliD-1-E TaxID=2954492 RepID=UPI0020981B96|nr:helix-turn-helix domain-containing protein [Klenkia sp. PcliD-1-E]MCO7220401.1 helix-turn-helix domain-containing protein [Klenkia sp. PcliD-1-E]
MRVADTGEGLLTTGEAAALLGVSRQHVVDLCTEGQLPHSWAGKHRRLRQRDVETLAEGNRRMTRDQVRSMLLAHAVAGHVATDPDGTRAIARANLQRMFEATPRGGARVWLQEWARLLDGPLLDLLATLTSPTLRSRELRQNSPFAGVLTEAERLTALATADAARTR